MLGVAMCSGSGTELADGGRLANDSKTESDHVVSLTSSTYGSLRLDPLPNQGEERATATSGSLGNTEDVKPLNGANRKDVENINMRELIEDIEDEKAAFQVFRGSMGKPPPRLYHTLEDVDTVLDIRRSLTADYRFRRGSSLESVTDETTQLHSLMLQKRRSRALQIRQEVIEELDNLRKKNLSRSQEFNLSGRRYLSQSQEFNPTGRSDVSRSLEFHSRVRRNLSQSQDFDAVKRINLTRNQELDSRRIRNLSRSQEFIRSPLAKPKEGLAKRHSSETFRTGDMKDERKIALSKPDVVLRSPMLGGLSGRERFMSFNAVNIEKKHKPLLQGQAQPGADWKTTLPRAAGSTKASMNLSSPERRFGKVLEPRVASAVAALSRLGEQRSASMTRSVSESETEVFQDQPSNSAKANYSASKISAYDSVGATAVSTQLIVPQHQDQDGRKISTVKKQADRSSSESTTGTSGEKERSAAAISSNSEDSFRWKTYPRSSIPQDMCSQGKPESLLDDPISLDYELVTKAEVAEAVLRSGSPPVEQSRPGSAKLNSTSDRYINKNTFWSMGSERRASPPLDPELLASFEEALEMFSTADDWCTVRIGESDDFAVNSGSASDADSPSWLHESMDHLDDLAGDAKLNRFKLLENHVEQPPAPPPKRIASSKMAPLMQGEEPKISRRHPLTNFEEKCPPGGEERCVLYTTSLRGIRKTFEDCSRTRRILQFSNVQIDERDIAMHGEFRQEVNDLVGRAAQVPRLFIRGRYIGGADEVAQLFEDGSLTALLADLPRQVSHAVCCGCGGVRFVPCPICRGSCKVVTDEGDIACCEECNENGLCRCPLCL